jgi:hypothetical protein
MAARDVDMGTSTLGIGNARATLGKAMGQDLQDFQDEQV